RIRRVNAVIQLRSEVFDALLRAYRGTPGKRKACQEEGSEQLSHGLAPGFSGVSLAQTGPERAAARNSSGAKAAAILPFFVRSRHKNCHKTWLRISKARLRNRIHLGSRACPNHCAESPVRFNTLLHNLAMYTLLEGKAQSELDLPRICSLRRRSKRRRRHCACSKRSVWKLQVGPIEQIEPLSQDVETKPLGEPEMATQSHVERGKIEADACVSTDADRPVIDRRIIIPVVAGDDVERQR